MEAKHPSSRVSHIIDSGSLVPQLHPDSNPSNPELHSQFVELNEAYRVLSKEPSRKEYDLKIQHSYQGRQAFGSTSGHTVYRR